MCLYKDKKIMLDVREIMLMTSIFSSYRNVFQSFLLEVVDYLNCLVKYYKVVLDKVHNYRSLIDGVTDILLRIILRVDEMRLMPFVETSLSG